MGAPTEPVSPASSSPDSRRSQPAKGRRSESVSAEAAIAETTIVAEPLPKVKDASHPLFTQDIQQMIVQTITRRKSVVRHDASWSQRRKFRVHQLTREGGPMTRPQFVEVLLRAAVALRGREPSTSGAFRKFAEKVLSGRIMQPPLSPFSRGLSLKAGVVRDTLLARRKPLRQAFDRFGSN